MGAILFALIVAGAAVAWYWSERARHRVDGDISDWTALPGVDDARGDGGGAELHSVKWAWEAGKLNLLVVGPVAALEGSEGLGDTVRVLIDHDGDADTGYAVRGLGAEWMVEVFGGRGRIEGSHGFHHDGHDRFDWSAWRPFLAVPGVRTGDGGAIELSVQMESPPAALLVHSLGADRSTDFVGPYRWDRESVPPSPAPAEPSGPDDHLEVDGHVGDWAGVPRSEPPPSPKLGGTGIDITGIRWTVAAARTHILIETAGIALAGEEIPVGPYLLPTDSPGPPSNGGCPRDNDCDGIPDADDADDDGDGIPDPFDLDPLDPSVGDHWPESGGAPASRRRGEDRLYLFFDLDGDGEGFHAPWLPFPADVATEVTGRAHQVTSESSFRWHLDGFVSLSGESVALAPFAVEIGGEWTSRNVFVLLTDWTAAVADSSAGELLVAGDLGLRFLSNPCTIDLATDSTPEDPAWASANEGWFNDTTGDAGSPRRDITAGKVCNNATWLFFLVDLQGVPIQTTTHTYTVYIDAGQDGSEDWALLFTYAQPIQEPVLFQNVSGIWVAATLPPGDHADSCNSCGFVELGVELSALGNPANISYYLASESDTTPGGVFADRGPDSGYSGNYTIPEIGAGAAFLVAGGSMAILAIGAIRRVRPLRDRHPTFK